MHFHLIFFFFGKKQQERAAHCPLLSIKEIVLFHVHLLTKLGNGNTLVIWTNRLT